MSDDKILMSQAVFSREANFYLSRKTNMYDYRVWARQNPSVSIGLKTDCLKLNVVLCCQNMKCMGHSSLLKTPSEVSYI
jgi:hypothetical protein